MEGFRTLKERAAYPRQAEFGAPLGEANPGRTRERNARNTLCQPDWFHYAMGSGQAQMRRPIPRSKSRPCQVLINRVNTHRPDRGRD
jgi:hypothetical protein